MVGGSSTPVSALDAAGGIPLLAAGVSLFQVTSATLASLLNGLGCISFNLFATVYTTARLTVRCQSTYCSLRWQPAVLFELIHSGHFGTRTRTPLTIW